MLATSLTVTGSSQQVQNQARPITREEHQAMMLKAMSVNIRSVARILKNEKVDIEAELLFTSEGRKKLNGELEKFPGVPSAKLYSEPLRGVVMAGRLTFAENISLENDAVVIARQVIFNGRAPSIKGSHDLHLFALTSISAANGPDTVVTIDTSGEGVNYIPGPDESSIKGGKGSVTIDTSGANGVSWSDAASDFAASPGSAGISGEYGIDGAAGKLGVCGKNNNAGDPGGHGDEGLPGGNGGNGARGKDGTDAHDQTITIPNSDAPYFQLVSKGGQGGNGGDGGPGGSGGRGGNGGLGGPGIGCQCIAGGVGDGGNGGNSGSGGAGGVGGKGGPGGNGGKAAHFVIFQPPRNYDMSHLKNFGGSGRGGRGGNGGQGGIGGAPGTPGAAGTGGNIARCSGKNGEPGSPGKPGERGLPGTPGDWGSWGATGSLTVAIF